LGILVVSLTIIFLVAYNIFPIFTKGTKAGDSFRTSYDNGSYNADYSVGLGTASTDSTFPTLSTTNAEGGSGSSLKYTYDGAETLKYATNDNLSASKGSISLDFQKDDYGKNSIDTSGQLYLPYNIAYDAANGYVYVADYGNNRIVKTKMDGTGWTTYGTNGSGIGNFNNPRGIAYDSSSGYIYVMDTSNKRIVKTKMDGTGWTTYGTNGSGVGNFGLSYSIVYDSTNSYLYVADTGNHRIVKTKMDGTGWTTYGTNGSGVGNFSSPYGITYDPVGDYAYVADYGNKRIVKTKMDGTEWTAYGTTGSGVGNFSNPSGISYDATGDYAYVADTGNKRIVKTKMDGTEWTAYGTNGSGVGKFSEPAGIVFDPGSGNIYVVDSGNRNIVKTKMDGTGWTAYGTNGRGTAGFNQPLGIAHDRSSGYIYVTDYSNNRIVKTKMDGTGWTAYGTTGSGVGNFNGPYGIAYDPASDYVYVADYSNNRIVKTKMDGTGWTAYGTVGSGIGNFNHPYGIAYDSVGDYVYVVDYGNNRIVKTKMDGTGWTAYGTNGSGEGNFSNPCYIDYDQVNDYVYVADYSNNRIVKTKMDGTGWTAYGTAGNGTGNFNGPRGITVDSESGNIFVTDYNNHRIVKTKMDGTGWTTYGTNGSGVGNFNYPRGIAYDVTSENIYIVDYQNNRVVQTKIDGSGFLSTFTKEKILFDAQGSTDELRLVYDIFDYRLRMYLTTASRKLVLESQALSLADGSWNNVQVLYDGTSGIISLNVNSTEVASLLDDTPWGNLSCGYYFYIGSRVNSITDRWDGMMDNITITHTGSDTTAPTNPSSAHFYSDSGKTTEFTDSGWGNSASPYITFAGAADEEGGSGIRGYLIYFGTSDSADPVSTSGVLESSGAYHYQAHSGAADTEQHIQVPAGALTSGVTYYLLIKSEDNDLNIQTPATKLFTYSYDGGPPPAPEYINLSPVGCSTTQDFTATWDAPGDSGGAGIAGYDYKNGSQGQVQSTADTTLSLHPYQEGDNVIYIRSKDNAGNVSAYQTGVYCSTGVVNIIDGPNVTAGPSSITVSWTTNKNTKGSVIVYEGNEYLTEQAFGGFDINHNVRVVGLEPERTYRYKVTWMDTSANTGESAWHETTTAVAPGIKNLEVKVLTPTLASVSWTTTYPAKTNLEFGVGDLGQSIVVSDTYSTEFSKELAGLSGGTSYQLRVDATAQDGTRFYGLKDFSTPPIPIISNLRFEPVDDQAYAGMKVTWATNVETTSSVLYGPSGGEQREVATSDMKKDHEISIANLSDNASYTLTASGTDQYGNKATSDTNTFKTALDSRPPKVTELTIESKTGTSSDGGKAQVVVSWRTDETSTSQVEYGEGVSSSNYSSKTQEDGSYSNAHVVIISNLDPTKTYHLRAVSKDKAGNPGTSEDNAVITQKAQQSALNLILEAFQRAFSWIKIFSRY